MGYRDVDGKVVYVINERHRWLLLKKPRGPISKEEAKELEAFQKEVIRDQNE